VSRRELARRALHAGLGFGVLLHAVIGWQGIAALGIAGVLANRFLLERWASTRWLLRPEPGGGLRGLVSYPLAITLLALLWREEEAGLAAGWLPLAVGDGLAPILARFLPRPPWPWNPAKSATAGLSAFALAGACLLGWADPVPAFGAALAGSLAESLPRPSEDNLMVPLAASGAFALLRSLAA
jgi:dolichol kinase